MQSNTKSFNTTSLCILSLIFGTLLTCLALVIHFFFPNNSSEVNLSAQNIQFDQEEEIPAIENELDQDFQDFYSEYTLASIIKDSDDGLLLYRQPYSRPSVEWFYFQITGNREVSSAILEAADKHDIPLSLAFALAHTESNYNTKAVHVNTNESTDRGLFQLNDKTFVNLNEEDFFDPAISSKYGISHLRFCIDTAGNQVAGLAMYNAGTGKVKSNRTPQITLNYVGKVLEYQKMLDDLFNDQVTAYFETRVIPGLTVAFADTKH